MIKSEHKKTQGGLEMSNAVKKPNANTKSYNPDSKPEIIKMAENIHASVKEEIGFTQKSCTEVIIVEKEIMVVGLSLQKSGLPISFDSLGKLWERYADENYRYNMDNQKIPIMEYGIALNTIPDYLTGCEVTKVDNLNEKLSLFIIPVGNYIKDTFNAETFYQLTNEAMSKRNVGKWAKENNIKIDNKFMVEVYPINAVENRNVEMYTLTPIK